MIMMMIVTNYSKVNQFFFYLEYWQYLLVCHLLDVMHVEKNVCESIYGTLLHQPGKTKDGVKTRKDFIEMKIREKLVPGENNRSTITTAPFTMSKEEKMKFCKTLLETKVPEGYSSNIINLVSINHRRL